MIEDKQIFYFNNEKSVITDPIMLEFGFLNNLIDWANENLYEWSNKTRKEKGISCAVIEILQCKGEYLEQYFNNALVLSIYAILENGLKRLSEFYESKIETNIKIKHFRYCYDDETKRPASSLEKHATYLEKIGICSARNNSYKILSKWTLVRNCIIHAGYEITNKEKVEIIKEVVKIDYLLEIVSSYSFTIDSYKLKEFVNTVEEYFISIFTYEIPNLKLKKN
ncbi:hypothetical protein LGL55_05955 [Clostridium tagluense]|uniref:hypothetical protein n=1 Tax=Clostridium tagluense TaxID=360422 RepID=UPI001CF18793|nr:hypothetical protein [Clostridium tagluense]MCB2310666.1 hypothetical protein [Clostridium tagluense]MCB2315603.1 hypothetical protein [Clostridium tagluense]MCB2320457.1 hypothetical protein [Clostridium tagluense]MCB2325260.1 hypothetical protein [Clostridium tagluense]MCB2330112.1 hypothetical protein [Clostridium tagluense]